MVTKKSAEVVETNPADLIQPYDRNVHNFDDEFDGADEVLGSDLLKDDMLDRLEGIPFGITHLTFRPSYPSTTGNEYWNAYVSVEAAVASPKWLKRRGLVIDEDGFISGTSFRPGDPIVFNDGSTGVYRNIVAYLETKGFIELPPGDVTGPKEKCRYDLPPSEWTDVKAGNAMYMAPGAGPDGFMTYEVDVRLMCPRGTRKSEYTNDFGDAATRYLA